MNQIVEGILWKIICALTAAVITWWYAGRWFRGMKITGQWVGKGDEAGFLYDFKAYLFLERSEPGQAEREVIGFILWEFVKAKPGFRRPIGSKGYEIVKGTLKGQKGDDKGVSLKLSHLGTTDRLLIGCQSYDICLTEKQTSCKGKTTTNTNTESGDLEGSVKGRF